MFILILLPLIPCSYALSRHSSIGNVTEVSRSIVMNLDARMTCLYETLEKNMTLSVTLSPMLDPFPMSLRLTSPSGQFSEWENGNDDVYMHHNVTEDGINLKTLVRLSRTADRQNHTCVPMLDSPFCSFL
ncbi:unnamed protein product [Cylicostephanus goldi]|uniref:Uncharacterized protein n=1 Tax=Cylicostephanus goldi TaxID=71465 RepID=A0A3P6RTM0_CYLGO|nr:unnamed protein product [Cylicostephanus goldi]